MTNARDILNGESPTAHFEGVGRLDSVDYIVDGVSIQSKYINGLRNSLDHVFKHLEAYPDFAEAGRYHIPSDQHLVLKEILITGKGEGLSEASVRAILNKVETIQEQAGLAVSDLIEPGNATYAEVQLGKIGDTLDSRLQSLEVENARIKEGLPDGQSVTLDGMGSAFLAGSAVGAGFGLAVALFNKIKAGKNPFAGGFSKEDWKELGVTTGKGAASGGVSAVALYLVTQATELAAPFAGAVVSATMGIRTLATKYFRGEIDKEEFLTLSMVMGSEAAIVGLCSFAGQAIIPVPILGALLGSLAGRFVSSLLKKDFANGAEELGERIARYEAEARRRLDSAFRATLDKLGVYFDHLDRLAEAAFDVERNVELRLAASASFAEHMGVKESRILRSEADVDAFMMS